MAVRCASASVLVVALGCATSPPPLPPRRPVAVPTAPSTESAAPGATTVTRAPDVAAPAEPPIRHVRYPWWTLLADTAAIVPLTLWITEPEKLYLPVPALVLTPLIHVAYSEPTKAGLSLAMRGAMLGVVYAAGRSAESQCDNDEGFVCVPIGPILLAEFAIITAITIDAVFARTTREARGWRRLPVLPSVTAGSEGRRMLSLTTSF